MATAADLVDQAQRAVGAGQRAFFEDDFDAARRHMEAAFKQFREAGDMRSAARVAAVLADIHADVLGNKAAGRGWIGRGMRLVDQIGPCVERGHLELALIACERPDVVELERSADRALALAIEFGDSELEVRALADGGLALVSQGRTREGFARLDEAMAAISAGDVPPMLAGKSFCAMLSACDRAGELERAAEWTRLVAETVLEPTGGQPRILHTHCREAYGSVLCTVGRWDDGEAAILEALAPTASKSEGHRVEATARLAELRILQGRADEARRSCNRTRTVSRLRRRSPVCTRCGATTTWRPPRSRAGSASSTAIVCARACSSRCSSRSMSRATTSTPRLLHARGCRTTRRRPTFLFSAPTALLAAGRVAAARPTTTKR